jgi:hypothetical protein
MGLSAIAHKDADAEFFTDGMSRYLGLGSDDADTLYVPSLLKSRLIQESIFDVRAIENMHEVPTNVLLSRWILSALVVVTRGGASSSSQSVIKYLPKHTRKYMDLPVSFLQHGILVYSLAPPLMRIFKDVVPGEPSAASAMSFLRQSMMRGTEPVGEIGREFSYQSIGTIQAGFTREGSIYGWGEYHNHGVYLANGQVAGMHNIISEMVKLASRQPIRPNAGNPSAIKGFVVWHPMYAVLVVRYLHDNEVRYFAGIIGGARTSRVVVSMHNTTEVARRANAGTMIHSGATGEKIGYGRAFLSSALNGVFDQSLASQVMSARDLIASSFVAPPHERANIKNSTYKMLMEREPSQVSLGTVQHMPTQPIRNANSRVQDTQELAPSIPNQSGRGRITVSRRRRK